jgi:uncharacterized protein with GYD domain
MEKSTESKQKYLVLVKLNPSKTENFYNHLMRMSERPSEGVRLSASYNVFGEWDVAVWFEAGNNDEAVHFIGEKLRSVDGVIETLTMPATTIKEYQI